MAKPKQTNTPDDWRFLADRDLSVAEHLAATMRPVPTQPISFFCHQAVEKYLKGVLVILGEEPPYIHDLDILCSTALKHRPSFASISSLCAAINYLAVQPRYDWGLDISEEDMKIIMAHTKTIKDFLQEEIPELFAEPREAENNNGEQETPNP